LENSGKNGFTLRPEQSNIFDSSEKSVPLPDKSVLNGQEISPEE
jgi:hypothetical protein